MLTGSQVVLFLPAALAVAAAPGANNLLALRNGLRSGFTSAAVALLGRFIAFAAMLGLVVAGLGATLRTSQQVFEILRVGGAAFMIGLGLWIIWSARSRGLADGTQRPDPGTGDARWRILALQEFLTAGANPKALLLFIAFLPPFVDTTHNATPGGVQLALLGGFYIACEALTALVWAGSGQLLAARGLTRRSLARLDQASGGAMVVVGGGLAFSDVAKR